MNLKVKHDTYEYDVVVNGITCDYCGNKEFYSEAHLVGEAEICDACYEGAIA